MGGGARAAKRRARAGWAAGVEVVARGARGGAVAGRLRSRGGRGCHAQTVLAACARAPERELHAARGARGCGTARGTPCPLGIATARLRLPRRTPRDRPPLPPPTPPTPTTSPPAPSRRRGWSGRTHSGSPSRVRRGAGEGRARWPASSADSRRWPRWVLRGGSAARSEAGTAGDRRRRSDGLRPDGGGRAPAAEDPPGSPTQSRGRRGPPSPPLARTDRRPSPYAGRAASADSFFRRSTTVSGAVAARSSSRTRSERNR